MRWLLGAATIVALALATALASRTFKTPPSTPVAVAAAAPTRCPDATLRPVPPLPEVTTAPLQLLVGPQVRLRIDGAEAGPSLVEGVHLVEATAPGSKPAKLQLQVDAFTPVLLDVRASSGAVTVLMVGGRCAQCANAVTDLDLRHQSDTHDEVSGVAKALTAGDWMEGAHVLRGIAPAQRDAPEVTRLIAILYAYAGRPSLAREQLAKLDDAPLRAALARRDALDELKPVRQLKTATARWNATTERFQRLGDRFVAEAAGPLRALTVKFSAWSKTFAEAREKKDAIGCEAALESANAALAELVMKLRARQPQDCAWQARVTESL